MYAPERLVQDYHLVVLEAVVLEAKLKIPV